MYFMLKVNLGIVVRLCEIFILLYNSKLMILIFCIIFVRYMKFCVKVVLRICLSNSGSNFKIFWDIIIDKYLFVLVYILKFKFVFFV